MTSTTRAAWEQADRSTIFPMSGSTPANASGSTVAAIATSIATNETAEQKANLSILDVGAGDGRVSRFFKGFGELVMVEPNPRFVEHLRPYGSVIHGGIEDVAVVRRFDVVFSFLVLQHYRTPERTKMIAQMADAAGQLLIIQLPLYEVEREPNDWTDVGTWTAKWLAAAAALNGFEVVRITETPGAYNPGWTLGQVPASHFALHVFRRTDEW